MSGSAVLERRYQAKLIKKIEAMLPGCMILKNDSSYRQGIPDLIVLYGPYWAMLEVKASEDADFQPNQAYYVSELNNMGYSAFIYPEIEEDVLDELQQALSPRRRSRYSQR